MRFGSLFSGIGGIDLGLERAGMECAWQVENNPYCVKVLEKHWPNVRRYGDIKEVDWSSIEAVDLICGGFPCQPVSVAGRRVAQADDRWLWPHFADAIRHLRPEYVLLENVPGLLSAGGGTAFAEVLGDLATCGYDTEWDCIPASACCAPHLRYRVLLVAYPIDPGPQGRQPELGRQVGKRTQPTNQGRPDDVPDAEGGGAGSVSEKPRRSSKAPTNSDRSGQGMAHADGNGRGQPPPNPRAVGHGGNPPSERCRARPMVFPDRLTFHATIMRTSWWAVEPDVGRVAHGVPHRVDRLRGLGNAVVPQVAEWIGRRIMEVG
jgi:DNA (cytosine-5)-methyltransferase 1